MAAQGAGQAPQPIAAGAPADLPDDFKMLWTAWADAKDTVVFERVEGKLVLKPSATHLVTYAPFIWTQRSHLPL